MPHPRRHGTSSKEDRLFIPFEDWSEYIETPPERISEMTLRRLTVMAKNLADKLDEVLSEIEKRMEHPRKGMEEGKH